VLVVAFGLGGAAAGAKKKHTDPESGQTLPLSVQRTGGDGKYEVVLTRDAFFGTYRAQVAQRKIRANKAPQTCKAAESKIIVLQ